MFNLTLVSPHQKNQMPKCFRLLLLKRAILTLEKAKGFKTLQHGGVVE